MTTQIVVTPEQTFSIIKKFQNSTAVYSSFIKNNKTIKTNVLLHKDKLYRLEKAYKLLPEILDIDQSNSDMFELDCVSKISQNTDIFEKLAFDVPSGIIHYDVTAHTINSDSIMDINPRLLIKHYNDNDIKTIKLFIDNNPLIVSKIKIFYVIMVRGGIICTTTNLESTLNLIIYKPSQNIIGIFANDDLQRKMMLNINLIWPIFDIIKEKKSFLVKFKDNIDLKLTNKNYPISAIFKRNLNSPEIDISITGESVYI